MFFGLLEHENDLKTFFFHIFLILKALEENFRIMKKHRNLSEYITYLVGMSSLFINLILRTSHYLHMKVINERISKWTHLSFYHKRFSRHLHLKFKKEVI